MPQAPRHTYWGLALIALATLMLQVSLTRIFSVTMWYHMALVSVSMAMFGMTLGALVVHWAPEAFSVEKAATKSSLFSTGFALSTALSIATCLHIPFVIDMSLAGVSRILLWNAVAAVPFLFSGVVVCVCLTRYPERVGRLYAFDLAGASLGCLLVVGLLSRIDAISAILLIGAIPAMAAIGFALDGRRSSLVWFNVILAVGLALTSLHNARNHWLGIKYVLGQPYDTSTLVHQEWNVFSYITVSNRNKLLYWGAGSNAKPHEVTTPSLYLAMDTRAATPIVKFENDWDDVFWLMYDVTNLVNSVRDDGDMLVIGLGGGRDVLSGLIPSRGRRRVLGLDINPITVDLHLKGLRDFSKIADLPGVTLINDEARSWVARTPDRFQVITIPLVDTSAASAAGAFALTENSLYTTEAFQLFLSRLTPDGVLSVSRPSHRGQIGEVHRLAGMAAHALRASGVGKPREHLYMALGSSLATLLVSKEPFTEADISELRQACETYGFVEVLSPTSDQDSRLVSSVEDPAWAKQVGDGPVKFSILPSSDDNPYFFHSYALSNLLSPSQWVRRPETGVNPWDREAILVLGTLMIAVTVLCLACIVIPLFLESGARQLLSGDSLRRIGFFILIGLGFMLFESAQMQRFSVFLGYPIYALTVVLFSLLLSSSVGAALVAVYMERNLDRAAPRACLGLLVTLTLVGLLTPWCIGAFAAAHTSTRILVAVALIAPAGLFLGMLFPLGLRFCERDGRVSLAWCWALNGVASTCSAVYSIALSISYGIGVTYWVGLACYVPACYFCYLMARDR